MGRPKKITMDIKRIIICLHRQNYSLAAISKYLSAFSNISLSRTSIKYTIDAHNDFIKHISHIKLVTLEKPGIPKIIMLPSGIRPEDITKFTKNNSGAQASLKEKDELTEHEHINSYDSKNNKS
jgi:hypothetical protein